MPIKRRSEQGVYSFLVKERFKQTASILVITCWILVILIILSTGLARTVALEIDWARSLNRRLKAEYLAKAGIEQGIVERKKDSSSEYDSFYELRRKRQKVLGRGKYTYFFVDEESKININTASVNTLSLLPELDTELARNIYNSAFKPFFSKEEILLVEGVEKEVFSQIKDFITVYSEGKVNINTAPVPVLKALGLEEDLVEKIEEFRKGEDGKLGTEDDRVFKSTTGIISALQEVSILSPEQIAQINALLSQGLLTVKSRNLEMDIGTEVDGKFIRNFHIVLKVEGEEMRIVRWEER